MFFSAASIAGAFSGLLAYAIAKLDGLGGLAGWRWIFILEGLATVSKLELYSFLFNDELKDLGCRCLCLVFPSP